MCCVWYEAREGLNKFEGILRSDGNALKLDYCDDYYIVQIHLKSLRVFCTTFHFSSKSKIIPKVFCSCCWGVPKIEPRAAFMQSRHSTTELHISLFGICVYLQYWRANSGPSH